jgi:hypothetical protein
VGGYDHGPLRSYELVWRSGHIETLQGHQVLFDSHRIEGRDFLASVFGGVATETRGAPDPRFYVHGEFDGRWRLVLSAPESELHTLRDVTDREPAVPEAAG